MNNSLLTVVSTTVTLNSNAPARVISGKSDTASDFTFTVKVLAL